MLSILKQHLLANPIGTSFPLPPFCLMVGGVSGVGKSALAGQLAQRLGAHLETTDHLREALRTAYPAEFYPELHAHSYTAWRALRQNGLKTPKVFQGLQTQARLLEKGVQAVASRVAREGRSLVLEGVHLLPGHPIRAGYPLNLMVLLVVRSPQEHLRRLKQRAQTTRRDAGEALAHFSQVRALQEALERRARLHRIPIIAADEPGAEEAVLALLKHQSQGGRP